MKRLLLIAILLIAVLTGCMTQQVKEVTVTTADEFINAIASNTNINIKASGTFELMAALDKLDESHDFRKIYNNDEDYSSVPPGVYYERGTLVIVNINNLTINGESVETTHIQSASAHTDVLGFDNCSNITIRNIKAGHKTRDYCEGDVVVLIKCENVLIENCDLYGCGYNGISIWRTNDVTVNNTEIRDCSGCISAIRHSKNVVFNECYMHNCREKFYEDDNENVQLNNCKIEEEGTGYDDDFFDAYEEDEYEEGDDYEGDDDPYKYIMPNPMREWVAESVAQFRKDLDPNYSNGICDGVMYVNLGYENGSVIFLDNSEGMIGAYTAEYLFNEDSYVFHYLDKIESSKGEKMLFGNGHIIAVKQEGVFSYEIKSGKVESITQANPTSDDKMLYRHGKTKDSMKQCTEEVAKPHFDFETKNVGDFKYEDKLYLWGVG